MIDLHCHILPGVDDGPRTTEESLHLLAAAAAAGTTTIVATSHVSTEYPNRVADLAGRLHELRSRVRTGGVDLQLLPGAEIAMTAVPDLPPSELSRLTLGGGRWLMIEPPFALVATGLDTIVSRLQAQGYGVVLAHPERCPALQRNRAMLEALVASGVLTSVTAGSLVGRFGRDVRRFARELVAGGLAHNVASDAHDALRRPPTIRAELEDAGLSALADWLTQDVPAAILRGGAIPPRPPLDVPEQRPRWRLGLG